LCRYIYKRLRFLGNRSLSQAIALFFLAAWHGLHMGYYVCFFMELIVMLFEKDVSQIQPCQFKFLLIQFFYY
jgi:lysophospholipid acyltransferase 5